MSLRFQEQILLSGLTTLKVGGPARFLAEITDEPTLLEALDFAAEKKLPWLPLGGGSNVLFSDAGWKGLILLNRMRGIRFEEEAGHPGTELAIAGGGENWDEFVAATVTRGLAGLEALSGIPGSVGATPVQNVGAYGQEIRQTMAWAWVFNLETRQWQLFENEACEFSYRNSRFKEAGRGVYFIAEVAFRLQKKGAPAIQYKDLREYLAKAGLSQPSLEEARNAVLTIRKRKGMVTDPADQDTCSCGSFFKNPIVSLEVVGEVIHRLKARGMAEAEQIMPRYPERDGRVKLSAAWLIERSGIRPGFKMGKAAVSSKHVLALTNTGGATAADMQTLAAHVQTVVFDAVGLTLEPEPDFLGFD